MQKFRKNILTKIASLLIIIGLVGTSTLSTLSSRNSTVFGAWLQSFSSDFSNQEIDFSDISDRNSFFNEAAQLIQSGKISVNFPIQKDASSDDIQQLLQSIWYGYSDAAGMNSIPNKLPNLESFGFSFSSYITKIVVGLHALVFVLPDESRNNRFSAFFGAAISSLPFLSGIAIGAP